MNSNTSGIFRLALDMRVIRSAQKALTWTIPGISHQSSKTIENQLARYQLLLETLLPRCNYTPPAVPRILNIGCGPCLEGFVLNSYFGRVSGAQLVGIDNNRDAIAIAREVHTGLPNNKEYEFVVGDARSVHTKKRFDIIVARHPAVTRDPWDPILLRAAKVTNRGGLFFGTTYWDYEQDILAAYLGATGWNITDRHTNPNPIPYIPNYCFFDRYVVIARKS